MAGESLIMISTSGYSTRHFGEGDLDAKSAFLQKLDEGIRSHGQARTRDAAMHQFLVIGAALAGFASLVVGLAAQGQHLASVWAGALGALTSVATVLAQQLHCVRAANWHDRMVAELDNIRDQFLFKFKSQPTDEQLSELADELAQLKLKMADAWAKVSAAGPTVLGRIKKPPKRGT
jgi:hypothetical protein